MVEFLQDKKFALCLFKLDWQCILLLAPKVINTISLRYKRLFLHGKTKVHVNQLKVKIAHLKRLTLQGCQHIQKIEQELKYIQSLKVA